MMRFLVKIINGFNRYLILQKVPLWLCDRSLNAGVGDQSYEKLVLTRLTRKYILRRYLFEKWTVSLTEKPFLCFPLFVLSIFLWWNALALSVWCVCAQWCDIDSNQDGIIRKGWNGLKDLLYQMLAIAHVRRKFFYMRFTA